MESRFPGWYHATPVREFTPAGSHESKKARPDVLDSAAKSLPGLWPSFLFAGGSTSAMRRDASGRKADEEAEGEEAGQGGGARRNPVRMAKALSEVRNPGSCPQGSVRLRSQVRRAKDEVRCW